MVGGKDIGIDQEVNKPSDNPDPNSAIDFLQILWNYTSVDAQCYSIVIISDVIDRPIEYKIFCLDEDGYPGLFREIRNYLSEKLDPSKHVYYQILPLKSKPKKGRGTEKLVEVGKWLWVDLDYKNVVDEPEFEGCRELKDYELECYYREGDKWIHVARPPLTQLLDNIRTKLGVDPTIVVDSGCGYHVYFKLSLEIDSARLKKLESILVDTLGGDPQTKDLCRILRLPGSINPRVNRLVKVIYWGSQEIDPDNLENILSNLRQKSLGNERVKSVETEKPPKHETKHTETKFRELSDSEILRIVDLLKDAYKPGHRQFLLLYLSGWLAKARVSPISAVKIVKHLYESTGDTDPIKTRLSAVVYSYKKAGINVDEYANDIEDLTGVKPYGIERDISEESVRGITGIQEILEGTLGEERALAIINELTEILQTLSPYRDSIIELIDYEKQLYAVANLKKLVIARAKRVNNTLMYKERVAVVAPTKVIVYSNPIGGITKYEVVFEGATLQRPLVVGPALVDEIAERIALEGVVYHRRLLVDVLSAIIQAFVRKNKAEVKTEIESPGFYWVNNKIVSVKYNVENVDIEKLRQALQLLGELAENWFKHIQDKFATVIKWGVIAPFNYVLKQRGKWIQWLYLYGDSATGKSTLGRIILKLWGLDSKYEKTGASVDTIARLGYVLSMSTFPVLINEPGSALLKEDVVEAIKNSVDSTLVRGKYIKGTYTEIPALSCLILTSNKFLPRDDALLRRFRVVTFSYGEKIPLEKQKEFKEKVEPRLGILSEIGKCVAKLVLNDPSILDNMDGKLLLGKCYEMAKLEKTQWLELEYNENIEFGESIVEEFVEKLKKYINDLFAKYVSRVIETNTETIHAEIITPDKFKLGEKLKILLEKQMMPGIRLLENNNIAITYSLLREIGLEKISLKSLAEIMGWEYKSVRLAKEVVKASITTVDKLIEILI